MSEKTNTAPKVSPGQVSVPMTEHQEKLQNMRARDQYDPKLNLTAAFVRLGRRGARYGSNSELKTGVVIDSLQSIKALGALIQKQMIASHDPKIKLEYTKLALNCVKASLTAAMGIDTPTPVSKPIASLPPPPAAQSFIPAFPVAQITVTPQYANGTNHEVVLSESR
jgi:hypothetical protein